MVAARRRDHAGCGNFSGQQIRESATRLEGTRMLKQLQLESEPVGFDPDIGAGDLDHRRATEVRPDCLFDANDRRSAHSAGLARHR